MDGSMRSSLRKPRAEFTEKNCLDVAANRSAQKWSRKELAGRVLWDLAHPLFALSPRPFWGWRRVLLRRFGAHVGHDVHIYPTALISIPWNLSIGDESAVGERAILYALGPITIGRRATISQGAHLCAGTHDYRAPTMPLLKRPIAIGDESWVCADAFIGPGVTVGQRTIVGARAVVMKSFGPSLVLGGNPARVLKARSSEA